MIYCGILTLSKGGNSTLKIQNLPLLYVSYCLQYWYKHTPCLIPRFLHSAVFQAFLKSYQLSGLKNLPNAIP